MNKVESDQLLCHKCLCKCPISEFSEDSLKGDMPICNTCLSELDGGKPLDPSIRAMTKIKCSRCRCWKYEREFSNPTDNSRIMRTCNSCRRRNKPAPNRASNHPRVAVKREASSSPETVCNTTIPVKTERDPKIVASSSKISLSSVVRDQTTAPAPRPLAYSSQNYPPQSTIKSSPPYSMPYRDVRMPLYPYPQFMSSMKPFPTNAEASFSPMVPSYLSRSLPTGVCGIPSPYPPFPRPYPSAAKEVCAIPLVDARSFERRLPSRQFVEAGDVIELTCQAVEPRGKPIGSSQPRSQLDILAALSMRELSSISEDKKKPTVVATKDVSSEEEKKLTGLSP